MTQRRHPLQGLTFKLALFYVALSLPALVLVEWSIVAFEFHELFAAVDRGRLAQMTKSAADGIGRRWQDAEPPSHTELATRAEALVLQLERPQDGLSPGSSYVLLELALAPVAISVFDADGKLMAQAPEEGWRAQAPAPGDAVWRNAIIEGAIDLPGADSPQKVRRSLAAIHDANGQARGYLLAEIRVPTPLRRMLGEASFEWPILLLYLIVFSIASALFLVRWVTRRLNTIADAATAWSRGDFSTLIPDDTQDELGLLSRDLNRMAQELKSLMRSRAELATLQERQRLARDLHDTVKQKAFALNLQIGAARRLLGNGASPHPASARLDESARLISEIQRELALVLDELRTPNAPRGFLAPRLRELAERWARSNGLDVELDLDEHVPDGAVYGEALMLIAEEALANVLRHSSAGKVAISLQRRDDKIAFRLSDNGVGGADSSGGMGLANMRERAERLPGGRFELDSAPGVGTVVQVRCNG